MAAPFITIGVKDGSGNDCVRLSDLKVKGYTDGCYGDVELTVLRKNGANETVTVGDEVWNKTYYWYEAEGEYEAGWYDAGENKMENDESPLGNAEDITFANGEGISFNAPAGFVGCTLECNGQVVTAKTSYIFTHDMQNICGNPLCRPVKLSELSISGYTDGCYGDVELTILRKNGANETVTVGDEVWNKTYYWYEAEGEYEAGWYDAGENKMENDESPLGNADEITFAMGEGISLNVPSGFVGCTLDFPSLGL